MSNVCKQIVLCFVFFTFSLSSYSLLAQEKKKAFEVSTGNFDQFSLRYKFGNEKYRYRISAFSLNANSYKYYEVEDFHNHLNAGLGFGIEFQKQINENLSVYYGPELRGTFRNKEYYSVSLLGILGLAYHFNETIRLGAEINPGISYYDSSDESQSIEKSFQFNFSNSGAALVLGFDF